MEKPYVISADLDLPGAVTKEGINYGTLSRVRSDLDSDLREMGKNTVWVESATIQRELTRSIQNTRLPVISLDDRYVKEADAFIGVSRGVDSNLNEIGYVPRVGYDTIERQLGRLSFARKEVMVVDDVLYSGTMIEWLQDKLARQGIRISALACGVAIGEGMSKLTERDIPVTAATEFAEVEDELCERDFAVVPGSGRRIDSLNANALYFDPRYGKPTEWASIPADRAEEFAFKNYVRSGELYNWNKTFGDIGNFYGWENTAPLRSIRDRYAEDGMRASTIDSSKEEL